MAASGRCTEIEWRAGVHAKKNALRYPHVFPSVYLHRFEEQEPGLPGI
jgi:hypothetical protein